MKDEDKEITLRYHSEKLAIAFRLLNSPPDLISRMQVSWPTQACPSSIGSSFWSHEWEKNGTCSNSILDQHEYFQASLNLKDKVDLLQILESAGEKKLQGSNQMRVLIA
uniref:Pentatricopeptide repeat-containing protein n=1 Tax=Quercus lobata TaxID=97700 RepID=A0A7N2L9Q4_QUELO